MKKQWTVVLGLLFLIALSGCEELLQEDEEINSDITSDTTWHSDSLYLVTSSIDIEADLTIEPGTRIEVEDGVRIQVVSGGSLVADGTAEDEIVFTGTQETPGWWESLTFRSSEHPNNLLNHVIIEYAGSGSPRGTEDANLVVGRSNRNADVTVTNTTLRHSGEYGMYLHSASDLSEFSNNTITNNENAPVRAGAHHVDLFDATTSYSGNDNDVFRVFSRDFSSDATWEKLDVPYLLSSESTVEGMLTIEAGTELQFDNDARLQFSNGGGLSAEGTEDEKIVFTGTQQTPGWWQGVFFRDSNRVDNAIDHAIFEYAGGDSQRGTEPANVIVGRSNRNAQVSITNTESRHSDGYGIYLHSASELSEFSNNTLTDNERAAARAGAHHAHFFDATSSYTGNEDDVLRIFSRDFGDDVTWEKLDVPYRLSGESTVEGLLTIEAGAELQFQNNARLEFSSGGGLSAQGTAGDEILFTGTENTPGWWHGLFFRDSDRTDNELEHIIVEYAGGDSQRGTDPANVIVGRSNRNADVTITDSEFRNSAGYGIYLHSASELNDEVCTVNDFSDNEDGDCGGSL